MPTRTRVAVVQMCATSDIENNLSRTEPLVAAAAADGAQAIFLPEAFTFIGSARDKRKAVEPLPEGGPIFERCRTMARNAGAHLILGFHETGPDDRSYNTCVHLDPDGELVQRYRKIHLFDVDLEDGICLLESQTTAPGDSVVVTDMPFGPLGLTICYDMRFPNLYQQLVDAGAVALSVPSAFTRTTGRDHWHVLLRARAIECQAYVIAAAQHGEHGHNNRVSYGHALIADPWGNIIAECDDGDGFALATIDPDRVRSVRERLPSLANRRI